MGGQRVGSSLPTTLTSINEDYANGVGIGQTKVPMVVEAGIQHSGVVPLLIPRHLTGVLYVQLTKRS